MGIIKHMSPKRLILLLGLMLLLLLGAVAYKILPMMGDPGDPGFITSFSECAEAGYPIMESYPRRCKTPDGKTFT